MAGLGIGGDQIRDGGLDEVDLADALYFNPASLGLFRFVDRTAQLAKSIDRSVTEFDPASLGLFRFVDRTARCALPVRFLNRGYHSSSYTYYYWKSLDHIDTTGASWPYGSSPPFGEISDVVGIAEKRT